MAARRVFGERPRENVHNSDNLNSNFGSCNRGDDADFRAGQNIDESNNESGATRHQVYPEPNYARLYQQQNFNNSNRPGRVRKPKYMPHTKSELELFDPRTHIQPGEHFDDLFGLEMDAEIVVTTSDAEQIPYRVTYTQSFQGCDFSQVVQKNIELRKYVKPTPIQRAIFSLIASNRKDIMAHAETGSGKTAAFLLPIINELERVLRLENREPKAKAPYCIILAPTKELVEQLFEETRSFALETGIKAARSYGDMPMRATLEEFEKGCDILVVTAGRLRHHISDHISLKNLRYFVLDEGDKLLSEKHFNGAVTDMKMHREKSEFRMLMFSATFNTDVQLMAQTILCSDYIFVRIGKLNKPVKTIKQNFIEVNKFDKTPQLLKILKDGAVEKQTLAGERYLKVKLKTIVFVDEKRQSDRVAITLNQDNIRAMSLNADRTMKQRAEAMSKFKGGLYDVLVTTDLAARGLNFPEVEHVIIYDLHDHGREDDYIHRIGRTGRAGNAGLATIFFDPLDGSNMAKAEHYIKILEENNQLVPDFLRKFTFEKTADNRDHQFYADRRMPERGDTSWGLSANELSEPLNLPEDFSYSCNLSNEASTSRGGHRGRKETECGSKTASLPHEYCRSETAYGNFSENASQLDLQDDTSSKHEREKNIFDDCW